MAYATRLGFETVTYVFAPQPTVLGGPTRVPYVQRIKPNAVQFNRIYTLGKYYRFDPIYRASLQTSLPIYWRFENSNLVDGLEVSPSPELANIKQNLAQFGYFHGVTVPLHLPGQKLAMVGMISHCSYQQLAQSTQSYSDVIMVLAHHFHERVSRMLPKVVDIDNCERLSPRETECLYWAAQGLTSQNIGSHLAIADVTVRFHLKNAAVKLSAVNRVHAVAKATYQGLINPAIQPVDFRLT
ncbi:MAG: LuxR family transcriptional regulator [Gammaproteobacteria bacterium]|nr:LuxR family transcriptional regulator [Gammaproteobacteria bacterium]